MSNELGLAAELERRITKEKDAEDFWHRYETIKAYLSTEYYPWIQANCPFFTDHGEQHISSVIQAGSLLLKEHLGLQGKSKLSTLDLFLILSGILWHDVGNVYGRSEHAARVATMTDEIKKLAFPTPEIHRLVYEISKAHAGGSGLEIPRAEEDCATRYETYTVYPRALAAIVRFADEISENQARISHALLPSVPEKSRIFWEYANCIAASRPEPERERVVVTVNIQSDKVTSRYECSEFSHCADKEGQVSLMEYIICRLEKMNNERVYCAGKFNRYASIREIAVKITISHATERLANYDLEVALSDSGLSKKSYPRIEIFEEFFKSYPDWYPARIQEVLRR